VAAAAGGQQRRRWGRLLGLWLAAAAGTSSARRCHAAEAVATPSDEAFTDADLGARLGVVPRADWQLVPVQHPRPGGPGWRKYVLSCSNCPNISLWQPFVDCIERVARGYLGAVAPAGKGEALAHRARPLLPLKLSRAAGW
jgi:hypothetical protein